MTNLTTSLLSSIGKVCSLFCILTVLSLRSSEAQDFSLVSTNAYATGVLDNDGNYIRDIGNFCITFKVTASENEDMYIRKDYNLLDGDTQHKLSLKLDGVEIQNFQASSSYLVALGNPNIGDWYSVLAGNSRTFQFVLSGLVPPQNGYYTWELSSIQISTQTQGVLDWDVSTASAVPLSVSLELQTSTVPEPSTITLGILSGIVLFLMRRR